MVKEKVYEDEEMDKDIKEIEFIIKIVIKVDKQQKLQKMKLQQKLHKKLDEE